MEVEFIYSNVEKERIHNWKESLPVNVERKFKYQFIENGKRDSGNYKLYDYYISTNLNEVIRIAKNITL